MAGEKQSVLVCVDEKFLDQIDKVAADLRAVGLDTKEVLPITGVVAGDTEPSNIADFKKVDGVLSVEVDRPHTAW